MGLASILLGVILVNNYVLAQFLGICPFLGVSKKIHQTDGFIFVQGHNDRLRYFSLCLSAASPRPKTYSFRQSTDAASLTWSWHGGSFLTYVIYMIIIYLFLTYVNNKTMFQSSVYVVI